VLCCRYFATWKHKGVVEEHFLPADVAQVTGQAQVPFGDGVLRLNDGLLASETCEELFTPQ
jgi:NAD+ synthase (glutamine-hydrolysing)